MLKKITKVLAVVLGLSIVPAAGACSAWTSFLQNPAGAISTLLQYVQIFLQTAAAIWAIIFPLIPAASQAQAQAEYENAVYTISQGEAALEDAMKAAAAAGQSSPNFSQLIANIQGAVDALAGIISKWGGGSALGDAGTLATVSPRGATAAQMAELAREQGVIHAWK
jgi:hypothetical protein